jgi:hypothetical protein
MCGTLYILYSLGLMFSSFVFSSTSYFFEVFIYIRFIMFWMSVIGLIYKILETFLFDICSSYRSVLTGIDIKTGIQVRFFPTCIFHYLLLGSFGLRIDPTELQH